MNTLNPTFIKKHLSVVFVTTFFVVLVLNFVSCSLGFIVSSYIKELTMSFHIILTTGRPRFPYMLYSEAISVTFTGIAAGLVFWVISLVLAYFFKMKITKPMLWLTATIASFCFGLWYYGSLGISVTAPRCSSCALGRDVPELGSAERR